MPLVSVLHAPSASLHIYICCTLHTFLVSHAARACSCTCFPAKAQNLRKMRPLCWLLRLAPLLQALQGPSNGCLLEQLILSLLSLRRPTLASAGCGQQCVVALHCRKQAWLPSLTCC